MQDYKYYTDKKTGKESTRIPPEGAQGYFMQWDAVTSIG